MGSKHKILVVDDEPKIVQLVRAYLEDSGFHVAEALGGAEALEAFQKFSPDLIVLDLMLPNIDGIDVTRTIRKESDVPIIMLTAKVEEVDRLIGLELGADDYVVKPFSPRELVARVRAVLRRTGTSAAGSAGPQNPTLLQFGALKIDTAKRRLSVDGRDIDLTALQFDILTVLTRYPGRVYSRSELLEKVSGSSMETYERTIDAHIKNLRRALGEKTRQPRFIHTVHGVGYRFDASE